MSDLDESFHSLPEEQEEQQRSSSTKSKLHSRGRPKQKPVTIAQLRKYKSFLEALSRVKHGSDLHALMDKMKSADFKIICNCMHDFLYDEGVMNNYFTDEQSKRLKHAIQPWSKHLSKFSSNKYNLRQKRKMLSKKQKGGGPILATVIGALLPMAVNAIAKLFKK